MKFVCELCHTKYAIADEKVRGKVLKVRCKTCANVITVRESGASVDAPNEPPAGAEPTTVSRSGTFDVHQAPTVAASGAVSPRKTAGAVFGASVGSSFAAKSSPSLSGAGRPTSPAEVISDETEWYMAVEGNQTGPFSHDQLIDKLLALPKDADVHIWNAQFEGWKPPGQVPDVNAELVRRRRLVASASPPPPPPSAATRRSTGGMAAVAAATTSRPNRPTGGRAPLAPLATEVSGGVAAKKVKKAGSSTQNGIPVSARAEDVSKDALAALDLGSEAGAASAEGHPGPTPPPRTRTTTGGNATLAASAAGVPSLPAPTSGASIPIPAPSTKGVRPARGRPPLKLVLGAAGVVVVVCGVVAVTMLRRPSPAPAAAQEGGGQVGAKAAAPDFAGLAAKLAAEERKNDTSGEKAGGKPPAPTVPPAVAVVPVAPSDSTKASGRSNNRRGARGGGRTTSPPPLQPTAPPPLSAEQQASINRFADPSRREVHVLPGNPGGGARSTPAQADISRVINANRQGIQTCYQRALLRDNSLVKGKITVRVSIGISGKVKKVSLDAPAQFRTLEPCIREVMSRWAFPPSSEEYGTEFPVVLQGS